MQPRYVCGLLLSALLLGGCGRSREGQQQVFKVSGKITMGGGPVANATVSYSPKGTQPVAIGRTGPDGIYTLTTYDPGDGAAAGEFAVLVFKNLSAPSSSAPTGHDPNNPGNFDSSQMHAGAGAQSQAEEAGLPAKYSRADSTDLQAVVKPGGENQFDFDLKP
ncbi:MAG TPA: hypothetical protein VHB77_08005 [Planctomycetaceae bacterium]|nr:hypothetical protein [Planctomycetaceae bacterium]